AACLSQVRVELPPVATAAARRAARAPAAAEQARVVEEEARAPVVARVAGAAFPRSLGPAVRARRRRGDVAAALPVRAGWHRAAPAARGEARTLGAASAAAAAGGRAR